MSLSRFQSRYKGVRTAYRDLWEQIDIWLDYSCINLVNFSCSDKAALYLSLSASLNALGTTRRLSNDTDLQYSNILQFFRFKLMFFNQTLKLNIELGSYSVGKIRFFGVALDFAIEPFLFSPSPGNLFESMRGHPSVPGYQGEFLILVCVY